MRARWVAAAVLLIGSLTTGEAVAGPSGGAANSQFIYSFAVGGEYGIPVDAQAVMLNVTAADPAKPGYISVYPCGAPVPSTSNLNYVAAAYAIPNAVIAKIGTDGEVCFVTSQAVDVIVDVAGYFPAGSAITPLASPSRILDTRDGTGAQQGLVQPGELAVQIGGKPGIPADASAVVINTTVADATAAGHVTAHACTEPLPAASNINFVAGDLRPNLVIARLDPTGKLCLHTTAPTHLIGDVIAYVPAGGSGYTSILNPARALDTRDGTGAPVGKVNPGAPVTLQVTGLNTVPAGATAVAINVTATEATAPGYVTVYPCGALPGTSNLNYLATASVANFVVAALSPAGQVCLATYQPVHLIADVSGYFTGTAAYVPLASPQRAFDTRTVSTPRCGMVAFPPSGTSLTVRNVTTGTQRTVTGAGLARALNPTLSPDCGGVYVFQHEDNGNQLVKVVEYRFDGSVTPRFNLLLGSFAGIERLVVTNDGHVKFASFAGAWDVTTGQQIQSGVGNGYRAVGFSADSSVIAYVNSNAGQFSISYFLPNGNFPFDTFELPFFYNDPTMSVDASFLAMGVPQAPKNGVPQEFPVITTFDGVVVDVYPFPIRAPANYEWLTDDTVIVCVPGQSPVLWKVYNGVTAMPGPSRAACPRA